MADVTGNPPAIWAKMPKVWLASAAIFAALAVLDPANLVPVFQGTLDALLHTAPFILFAVLAIGYLMAFWLASPLMDPAMFLITSGTLGWDFAIAKTIAAVSLGMFGGFATMALARTPIFTDPLREVTQGGCGCGSWALRSSAASWLGWFGRRSPEATVAKSATNHRQDRPDCVIVSQSRPINGAVTAYSWLIYPKDVDMKGSVPT